MTEPADEFFGLLHEAEQSGQLQPLEDPGTVIREQCQQWAAAALELRFGPDRWPGDQASPSDVMKALVIVRSRLDAMEGILGNVLAVKAMTAASAREQEQQAEDAWDDQAQLERTSRRPRPEYQGSRERYAYWNIAIRGERAAARQARDLADYTRGVYDTVKLAYDGLNETRRDLAARLTHFRWESSMEQ